MELYSISTTSSTDGVQMSTGTTLALLYNRVWCLFYPSLRIAALKECHVECKLSMRLSGSVRGRDKRDIF